MLKQGNHKSNAAISLTRRASTPANKAHLPAWTPSWLRPADQLDYMIRRWAIGAHTEGSQATVAPTPAFRSFTR